jgi:hypothetical protein
MDDSDLLINADRVRRFADTAQKSERLVYFIGRSLGEERAKNRTLSAAAQAAYDLAQEGVCSIVQKRDHQDGFTLYLLEKR